MPYTVSILDHGELADEFGWTAICRGADRRRAIIKVQEAIVCGWDLEVSIQIEYFQDSIATSWPEFKELLAEESELHAPIQRPGREEHHPLFKESNDHA